MLFDYRVKQGIKISSIPYYFVERKDSYLT